MEARSILKNSFLIFLKGGCYQYKEQMNLPPWMDWFREGISPPSEFKVMRTMGGIYQGKYQIYGHGKFRFSTKTCNLFVFISTVLYKYCRHHNASPRWPLSLAIRATLGTLPSLPRIAPIKNGKDCLCVVCCDACSTDHTTPPMATYTPVLLKISIRENMIFSET